MRNLEFVSPLAGHLPEFLDRYSAETELGRSLRQQDAARLLQRMDDAEACVAEEEGIASQCVDRIERLMAGHRVNIKYRIAFGVAAHQREVFQDLLRQTMDHGGFTLREAARLADAVSRQRNGLSGSADGEVGPSSPDAGGTFPSGRVST